MNGVSFVLIVTGVLLNAAAQLWLKAGTNALGPLAALVGAGTGTGFGAGIARVFHVLFEPHILAGLGCYVLSVAIWIVVLSRVPVSVAYPMLSIGYVVNTAAAWYLFDEYPSAQKLLGIAVIIVGVFLVARS